MQKLYCYVDESGQDTKGEYFFVAVVVTSANEREELRTFLKNIEAQTDKRAKWFKSDWRRRRGYINAILTSNRFQGKLFFAHHTETKEYLEHLIADTAKAILRMAQPPYQVTVLVDALGRSDRRRFGKGLRALKVHVEKVRGLSDESDEFIRLADAIAGFIRDGYEQKPAIQELYQNALRTGLVEQLS